MIFIRDFVTCQNQCRIASLATKKIIIHANSYIVLFVLHMTLLRHG